MEKLQKIFKYNSNDIRTTINNNREPLFCGKDVCSALQLQSHNKTLSQVLDKDKAMILTHTLGGKQVMIYLTEPGLYKLIMKSRKKEALEFQDWIFETVLPEIRKTGAFKQPEKKLTPAELILKQAQALVTIENQVSKLDSRLSDLENYVSDTKQLQENIEYSGRLVSDIPIRKKIQRIINNHCAGNIESDIYKNTWNKLYREIYYRQGIDLKRSKNKKPLDKAEDLGILDQVYDIASFLFSGNYQENLSLVIMPIKEHK